MSLHMRTLGWRLHHASMIEGWAKRGQPHTFYQWLSPNARQMFDDMLEDYRQLAIKIDQLNKQEESGQ